MGQDGGDAESWENNVLKNRNEWPLNADGLLVGNILLEALFSALNSGKGEAHWCPLKLKAGVWPIEEKAVEGAGY